jgi:UDP-glucose:glycoprotein glucosyltransferase
LKTIREERELILSLLDLGLTPKQAFELISDHLIGGAQVEDDPGEGFVDASDRIEGEGVITWWNDVEKDARWVHLLREACVTDE